MTSSAAPRDDHAYPYALPATYVMGIDTPIKIAMKSYSVPIENKVEAM
jgi:hypothetical protein